MTRVRALDLDGDWQFGKGRNNYRRDQSAVVQNIATRLNSYLGDCFFATGDGVDWFNLLGSTSLLPLELALKAVILNTVGVTGLIQLSLTVSTTTRRVAAIYQVQTVYGRSSAVFEFDTTGAVAA